MRRSSTRITVDNTGNVDLTNVVVDDVFAGGATLVSGDTNANSILEATETWVYSADHAVTQADLNAGRRPGQRGDGDRHRCGPGQDDATVTVAQSPALNIVKDADVASVDSTSDIITYTYTVTNTGNAAIANVVVTDDNLTPGSTG